MYKPVQKKSSSWTPASSQSKSKSLTKPGTFSVQPKSERKSSQQQEMPSYSTQAADALAANVMRSLETPQQEHEEAKSVQRQLNLGAAFVADGVTPIAPSPTPSIQSKEVGIQRQCAECAKEQQEQSDEEGKDVDDMSLGASGIQTKLTVGAPGDKYEQEADRVAAQVMSMSVTPDSSPQVQRFGEKDNPVQRWSLAQSITPVVQRQVDELLQMRKLVQRAFQSGGNEASGDLESRLNASSGGGNPLAPEVRAFMEPRFGADFSGVRVHTGSEAVQMNRELGAQAFTHGSDVYFGAGKSPGNNELTAHELTHVVQQVGIQRKPALNSEKLTGTVPTPLLQRQDASTDERVNDPNFLMCLALCELGIPPSLWRTVVNEILRAVSQEYRDRLGDMRGSQEFESWRAAFTVMSTFNKLKAILGFLGESRIGPLTIERPAAQAIRRAVLARLAERGLESATIEVASQIVRKVAVAIEVAIAVGCTTYCGTTAMINALLDFSSAALDAITSFINTLSQVGAALGQAIARPILIAQASMDPTNWNLSALPTRSRAHMGAIGIAFRLALTPDSFLTSMGRPLSSYNIQQILVELAQDINTVLQARGGFAQLVTFTTDFIGRLTPLQFVDILKDYRLLSFVQDPGVLVDQQQAQQSATPQ